ncbi:MAG: LPS assembly protein LptD [Proteobacteria bacterium]|nr:LPS assembly protein LptD [Pseudomonadota bacterium]MBS0461545.1 LPS assembly protein LptD [Pseudomonadota bacterium]
MRSGIRLLPLCLAIALACTAYAKPAANGAPRKDPTLKHPADEFVLCRGNAVPEFPGIAPIGKASERPTAPADVQADLADLSKVGISVFDGHVEIRHADQWTFADHVSYDHDHDTWQALGNVKYQDNTVRLTADRADGDRGKDITTLSTQSQRIQYQLRNTRGNGQGDHGKVEGDQESFWDATWSTCDPQDRKWEIHADQVDMDRTTNVGTAHGATVKIGNVPVLYLPWMSFSLDNERKSGLLTPSFGMSERSGFMLSVPYYFNLAPNYDATLTGRYFGDRGLMLDGQFRYITASHGQGIINATWLPDDRQVHRDRGSLDIQTVTSFTPQFYALTDIHHVSDPGYLQDFSEQPFANAIGLLSSTAGVYGRGRYWTAGLYVQDWQITDPNLTKALEPFRRTPDLWFRWNQPFGEHLELGVRSEAVRFEHDELPGGSRTDFYPYVATPFSSAAWYVRPELGYRYTRYQLEQPVAPGDSTSPSRGMPIASVDAGAFFERDANLFGHAFINTLEPRLYYLYVPYRNQDDLPVFDTQQYSFAWDQLFRTNTFAGADRQTNANQLTAAITTRLLDASDGHEWFNASIGQIRYFQPPRVLLPGDPYAALGRSDLAVNANLALDDHWTMGAEYLYDPHSGRSDLFGVRAQYHFGHGGIVSVGYRYRPDLIRQSDVSFIYPLNENWRLLGRWNYSLLDHSTLEGLAGVEWQDCCMAVRALARRYIHDTSGDKDTAIFLEIELKGLGSLGRDTGTLLERDILGYSR